MPEEVHLGMADQYTGAMVALVPSREDAKRLAVDGGEDVDQLHCTLLYLGDAADLDDHTRQGITAAVGDVADGYDAAVEADGFAICLFNPKSDERDPCIVLGLSGDGIADLHDEVTAAVEAPVDQHRPWYPHVTLVYDPDPSMVGELTGLTEPVAFDRIRVAFGGEIHDYPLGPVEVAAAAGRDITPGHDQLHHYWTRGEGLAKWAGSPTPWTTLYHHLVKYAPSPEAAKRWASKWFKEVMGIWSGERKGQNPLGPG